MTKMKLFASVFAVALLSSGLGGCFDGLSDSVERLAGIPGAEIRGEIDEGLEAAEANEQQAIDDWIAEKETEATGTGGSGDGGGGGAACTSNCAIGDACTSSAMCASGNCDGGTCSS